MKDIQGPALALVLERLKSAGIYQGLIIEILVKYSLSVSNFLCS